MRSRPGAQHQSAECSIASCVVLGSRSEPRARKITYRGAANQCSLRGTTFNLCSDAPSSINNITHILMIEIKEYTRAYEVK